MSVTPVASQRIYGKALWLQIDGTNYAMDIKECVLNFEPKDTSDITFAEATLGGDQGTLAITAIQSTEAASFWRAVWDHRGQDLPFTLAVHGNETASETQPHITGTVTIGARPSTGGAADPRTSYSFEVEWTAQVDDELKTV